MRSGKIAAAVMAATMLFTVAGCSKDGNGHINFPGFGKDSDNGFDVNYVNNADSERIRNGLAEDWMNGEPWFINENGIKITDPGHFQYTMGDVSSDSLAKFPADVTLEESYDDCEDGYKTVTATCTFLRSAGTSAMWASVFDKYTGYTFECSDHTFQLYDGCYDPNYSTKDFKVGKHKVHIEWTLISEQKGDLATLTLIVKCPVEYNGCVFMFGPVNSASRIDSCNLDHELYDIIDIDYIGDDYVYFTIEAKQVL